MSQTANCGVIRPVTLSTPTRLSMETHFMPAFLASKTSFAPFLHLRLSRESYTMNYSIFVVLLSAFLSTTTANALSGSATLATSYISHADVVTTPAPNRPPDHELRKRQPYSQYICGYSDVTRTRYCVSSSDYCTATIFPNGQAYAYCSDPNVDNQVFVTTGYNSWNFNTPCPSLALCWYVHYNYTSKILDF